MTDTNQGCERIENNQIAFILDKNNRGKNNKSNYNFTPYDKRVERQQNSSDKVTQKAFLSNYISIESIYD